MYQQIQNLKKQGCGKLEIGRNLKLDPATVRKYFDMKPSDYLKYLNKTLERLKIFQSYKHKILLVYENNKNQKLNMSAVYDFLEEKYGNLPGSEK